jgi:hypothetical protein
VGAGSPSMERCEKEETRSERDLVRPVRGAWLCDAVAGGAPLVGTVVAVVDWAAPGEVGFGGGLKDEGGKCLFL